MLLGGSQLAGKKATVTWEEEEEEELRLPADRKQADGDFGPHTLPPSC